METLFIITSASVFLIYMGLRHLVPVWEKKVENYHQVNLREIELEEREIELRKLEVELRKLEIEKGVNVVDLDEENEVMLELTNRINESIAKTNNAIESSEYYLNTEFNALGQFVNEELQRVIDRLEKLELKQFNGIDKPKVDIKQTEKDSIKISEELNKIEEKTKRNK